MATTFEVCDERHEPAAWKKTGSPERIDRYWRRKAEASGCNATGDLIALRQGHGLLATARLAFERHYDLALQPDDLWLAIAQGFAIHLEQHAEDLRPRLVAHVGQETIAVRRDDFVKGSPDNDWPSALGQLSDGVAAFLGKKRDLIVCDFSTTGPVERAASEIVLMAAMKHYLRYQMWTLCGIPHVTLLGDTADWEKLRRKTRALGEFELSWWTDTLDPILEQFIAASAGEVDAPFWQSIFKLRQMSGGPFVDGWLAAFFPYLVRDSRSEGRSYSKNPAPAQWRDMNAREQIGDYPDGLRQADLVWKFGGAAQPAGYKMEFIAGFFGTDYSVVDRAERRFAQVRPVIGWALRDAI
jgi:hypothetical protein